MTKSDVRKTLNSNIIDAKYNMEMESTSSVAKY